MNMHLLKMLYGLVWRLCEEGKISGATKNSEDQWLLTGETERYRFGKQWMWVLPLPPKPFPWWLANSETWVSTNGATTRVEDMTEPHVEGVCEYLLKLLEPNNNMRLRHTVEVRMMPTGHNGACDDGFESYCHLMEDATPGGIILEAYPAAKAIIARAKTLGLPVHGGLDAIR